LRAQRKSPLKILLLSNKVPYPAKDGSSIAIKNMISSLQLNNIEVSLLALNTVKHHKSSEEIQEHKPANLHLEYVNANTNPTIAGAFYNIFQSVPFHVSRFRVEAYEKKLIEILKNSDFDIVQIEGLSMTVYIDVIRKYSSAKISFRSHNVEYLIWNRLATFHSNPFYKAYLKMQSAKLKAFELNAVQKVDAVVSITKDDLEIFEKQAKLKNPVSIPCGLNPEEYSPENIQSQYDIAYLASFDWLPNVQGIQWFLEKVWPLIMQKKPHTTFVLGGRKIPPYIASLALHDNITLEKDVPEMKAFIAKGKIVIVPLQAGSGMRIKIVENMALAKAMVSTTVGAEGIAVKNEESIMLADKPADFADAVLKLIDNDELRKNIEQKARLTVEKHYNNLSEGLKKVCIITEI